MKKILIVVLAVVLVFAFATTAFAGAESFAGQRVYGGGSQTQSLGTKSRANIRYYCTNIDWLGETDFKYRGYDTYDNSKCSALVEIEYEGQYYYAYYTKDPTSNVRVKASIKTTDTSQYLRYWGQLRF